MDGQAHADVVQRLWVQAQKEQCANAMLYNRMVQVCLQCQHACVCELTLMVTCTIELTNGCVYN